MLLIPKLNHENILFLANFFIFFNGFQVYLKYADRNKSPNSESFFSD